MFIRVISYDRRNMDPLNVNIYEDTYENLTLCGNLTRFSDVYPSNKELTKNRTSLFQGGHVVEFEHWEY